MEPTKVVVVGGSGGIGLSVACRLARDGAAVALVGRSAERLAAAASTVVSCGASEVLTLEADAGSDAAVAGAYSEIADSWGHLNAVVNAVGPNGHGTFERLADAQWEQAFDTGVLSAVRSIRHALPLLRAASWARIVNITAVSVRHQTPGLIAYTAAKAALASVTKNLARTLAGDGILVNAVAPGPVLTEKIAAAASAAGADPQDPAETYAVMARLYGASVDLARVAQPQEIAEVAAFCAGAANTYMTGATLNVDGGSDYA